MPYINPRGNPQSPVWIILERPFSSDITAQICASGGMGFFIDKMLREAHIPTGDTYVLARRPDTDNPLSASSVEAALAAYKPPLILACGESARFLLPELRPREEGKWKTQLGKYVGSLLRIPAAGSWDHWIMPIHDPETLVADWAERNVTTYVDLGKIKEELSFWIKNKKVRPYLERKLLSQELTTSEVIEHLDAFFSEKILSVDIETIYPRKNSEFYGEHPGVPITIGIASSPTFAISFNPFRPTPTESVQVWRKVDSLLQNRQIIGQNFYNFDSYFFNMIGVTLSRNLISDTLIRHHILWPELPHSLQFLTRQYTRQPYYKDEAKSWNMKQLSELRHYNCLDASVTFEVYNAQEDEFNSRPHLR